MISDTIDIDAQPGIDALRLFADAAEELPGKFAAVIADINAEFGKLGTGIASSAGPDKFLAGWKSAQAEFSAVADKIKADIDAIGEAGAGIGATADKLTATGDAGKTAADGLDSAAASAGKADDALKGAADAGAAASDAIKAAGDAGKAAGDGLDLGAASASRFAQMMRDAAAASADASLSVARSQAILADAGTALTTSSVEQDAAIAQSAKVRSAAAKQAAADAEATSRKYTGVLLGGAAAAGYGIYEAAQLQTQVTRLYTSAGESQKNLPMIQAGILGMAGPTATDQSQLAQGAYWVESAGFHGQSALNVLRSVAQGAYAEGAPLQDVANAATSILTSYGMYNPSQKQSNAVINQMLSAVGSGKMTMAQLSTALPAVLPVAASAGLSIPQVLGSLATMTAPGMSAEWASQNLRHTIGVLQNPNSVQTAEMYQLGLDPVAIEQNLGKTGISGTVNEIQAAVKAHEITSGADKGMVQLPAMNISKAATQDALIMMKQMPPAIRATAQAYYDGKISAAAWNQEMFKGSESGTMKNLLSQFATVTNLAHGYNSALKAGQPDVQAYNAAVSKLLGGTVGMQTFLDLTGQHAKVTAQNIGTVSQAAKDAGQNVQGWGDIQKTFNYQLKDFEYSAKSAATTVGAALLPATTDVMSGLAKAGSFLAGHKTLTTDLTFAGGAIAAINLGKKIASPIETALQSVGTIATKLNIPGLDKLAGIGKDSSAGTMATAADTNVKAAGTMADAAAMNLDAAKLMTGSAGESKLPGVIPGKAAGGVAAEEEAAAAGGIGAALKTGIGMALRGGLTVLIGDMISRALMSALPQASPSFDKQYNSAPGWSQSLFNNVFGKQNAENFGQFIQQDFQRPVRAEMSSIGDYVKGGFTGDVHAVSSFFGSLFGSHPAAPAATPPPPPAESQMPHLLGIGGHAGTMTAPSVQPAKVPAPDLSAVDAAKSRLNADVADMSHTLGTVSSKPAKIAAPDLSAVDSAKGKAQADAQNIWQAAQQPLTRPVKAAPPDIAAFAAARGPAQADGSAISAGLASGILAGEGAVVAAAQQVAAAAAAAMKTSLKTASPSKVTEAIGKDTVAGLVKGINESADTAKTAAVTISSTTVNTLTQGLQGGQSAIQAALTALGSPNANQDVTSIQTQVAALQTDISDALSHKNINTTEDSALVKWLKGDEAKLESLSAKRDALETEISDAQQAAQSALSQASIMNAASAVPSASLTPQGSAETVQGMQYQAQQQQQFAQQLQQLKSQGLNATELSQLGAAGATAGLPVTEGLVGNKQAIQQLNQAQSQITAASAQIGNIAGVAGYQSGQTIMNETAKGLKSQLSQVDSAISKLATSMVDGVKAAVNGADLEGVMKAAGQSAGQGLVSGLQSETAAVAAAAAKLAQAAETAAKAHLKASSPSLLFREIGADTGRGFAGGMDSMASLVSSAAARMGQHAATAMHPASAAGGGYAPHGGGQAVHVHITVNVAGSVTTQRDLLTSLQGLQLDRALHNYQGGWSLPYKRA